MNYDCTFFKGYEQYLKCSNANFLCFWLILKQALILARILGRRINLDSIQVCLAFIIFYFPVQPFLYLGHFFPYVNNFVCISQIESLYPEEMGPGVMTVEDFLSRGLLLLDRDIQERVEKAASNGNVLRYVCVIEGSRYLLFPSLYVFVFNQALVSHLCTCGFSPFSFSIQSNLCI